jgi:hypothetical protein
MMLLLVARNPTNSADTVKDPPTKLADLSEDISKLKTKNKAQKGWQAPMARIFPTKKKIASFTLRSTSLLQSKIA